MKDFIIPAIDIKDEKVVRLLKGDYKKATVYNYKPSDMAKIFQDIGFKRLHVVDLNGSKEGKPVNIKEICKIRSIFTGKIQVGGGIRTKEDAKLYFEEGVDFIILGTVALTNPDEFGNIVKEFPKKVILAIDTRYGKIAIQGWTANSEATPEQALKTFDEYSIWGYLYTIIEKDGSMEGVDPSPYAKIKSITEKYVLASGGVSSIQDIQKLHGIVDGVVVGKAIYEGKISLENL